MENEKRNIVCCVAYNQEGECIFVAKKCTLTQSEYTALLKEQNFKEREKKEQVEYLQRQIDDLTTLVSTLTQEIKVLKGEE